MHTALHIIYNSTKIKLVFLILLELVLAFPSAAKTSMAVSINEQISQEENSQEQSTPDSTRTSTKTWEDFVNFMMENEELAEDEEWKQNLEEYEELVHNPININSASKKELLLLPFINDRQASDISDYVARHGGMNSLYELVYIPSISLSARSFLPLFTFVGSHSDDSKDVKIKGMLKKAKHELLTRFDIPLYKREGYLKENGYRGAPLYNKTKYSFSATSHIQASLHIERDAGERGIDSYGGQVLFKDFGNLSTLVIGDYKLGFGEGLVVNQGFSLSKGTSLTSPRKGIKAHTGTDEFNFMRGIATTLSWRGINLSAFFSKRNLDATTQGDSCVNTIIKSGYHRTETEWKKKGDVAFTTSGAHIEYQKKEWHIGATGYSLKTSLPLNKGNALYKQIAPEGSDFSSVSVDYGYQTYRWNIHGETAHSLSQGGVATTNTVDWLATNRYTFSLSQRYFDKSYYSFYAKSLSENTSVQNETGMTLRMDAVPMDGLQVSSYLDFFYNAWPRYGLTHSSQGYDFLVSASYQHNSNNEFIVRYNLKSKEYSKGQQTHHKIRVQWNGQISKKWSLRTIATLHAFKEEHGEAISQSIRYKRDKKCPLQIDFAGTYFYTTNYDSRVFLYEPNVIQSIYVPSLYGQGLRFTGMIKCEFWQKRLRAELKYGVTKYLDNRTSISSGLETIHGDAKNDIVLQLRYVL